MTSAPQPDPTPAPEPDVDLEQYLREYRNAIGPRIVGGRVLRALVREVDLRRIESWKLEAVRQLAEEDGPVTPAQLRAIVDA